MSVFWITPAECPECGELATCLQDTIRAWPSIITEPDGSFQYEGDTDVDWDSQTHERDANDKVTACCVHTHLWAATVDDEERPERGKGTTWLCRYCGDPHIQFRATVGANDWTDIDWEENPDYWCPSANRWLRGACELTPEGGCNMHDGSTIDCYVQHGKPVWDHAGEDE